MGGFRSLAEPRSLRWLLVIGVAGAAWFSWSWWSERNLIRRAREVPAEILEVTVRSEGVGTGASRERNWHPVVHYRYAVDGRTYESRRVTPLGKGGSRAWAEEIAARFRPGDDTRAWVDPEDPTRAFLLPVASWKEPVGLAVTALMALVSGFMLWRQRGAAPPGRDSA